MEDAYTLTPEQIEADKIRIIELLKGTGRPGIERLVEWMETKSDFFTAPASTKYHLHCKGGLARHSLNVYERLKAKVDSGLLELKDDTVVITTLLHDVCKANFYAVQKRNRKIDGQWQEVEEWGIDEKLPIGHGEKSCYIVQSFMRLSLSQPGSSFSAGNSEALSESSFFCLSMFRSMPLTIPAISGHFSSLAASTDSLTAA